MSAMLDALRGKIAANPLLSAVVSAALTYFVTSKYGAVAAQVCSLLPKQ